MNPAYMDDGPDVLCFMFLEAHGFALEQSPFLPICFAAQGFLAAQGPAIFDACDIQGLQGWAAKAGIAPVARVIRLPPASAITTDLALGFFFMVAYSLYWRIVWNMGANPPIILDFDVSSLLFSLSIASL